MDPRDTEYRTGGYRDDDWHDCTDDGWPEPPCARLWPVWALGAAGLVAALVIGFVMEGGCDGL